MRNAVGNDYSVHLIVCKRIGTDIRNAPGNIYVPQPVGYKRAAADIGNTIRDL